MLILSYSLLMVGSIMLALLMVIVLLSNKSIMEEEQASPFECGFLPQKQDRSPFSMHFFLLSLLFLVFDVELVLLFPWFLGIFSFSFSLTLFISLLLFLLLGLIYEWNAKMLDWIDLR